MPIPVVVGMAAVEAITGVATDVGAAGMGEVDNTTVEEGMGVQAGGMAPVSRMVSGGPSLASRQSLRLPAHR
jgi:hypothetical protein